MGTYLARVYVALNYAYRDVAQVVEYTSGGREVASSSLVIPTQ